MGKCREAGRYKEEVCKMNIGTRQNNAKLYSAEEMMMKDLRSEVIKRAIKYEKKARRSETLVQEAGSKMFRMRRKKEVQVRQKRRKMIKKAEIG